MSSVFRDSPAPTESLHVAEQEYTVFWFCRIKSFAECALLSYCRWCHCVRLSVASVKNRWSVGRGKRGIRFCHFSFAQHLPSQYRVDTSCVSGILSVCSVRIQGISPNFCRLFSRLLSNRVRIWHAAWAMTWSALTVTVTFGLPAQFYCIVTRLWTVGGHFMHAPC